MKGRKEKKDPKRRMLVNLIAPGIGRMKKLEKASQPEKGSPLRAEGQERTHLKPKIWGVLIFDRREKKIVEKGREGSFVQYGKTINVHREKEAKDQKTGIGKGMLASLSKEGGVKGEKGEGQKIIIKKTFR